MTRTKQLVLLLGALVSLAGPNLAHAYIGPGAGLSAIGSLLALIAAVFVAIFGFLWYPIKSWRKRRAAAKAPAVPEPAAAPAEPGASPAARTVADTEKSATQ